MGFYPTLRIFTVEKPIALLAFLADRKDSLHNCGLCESENVQVPANLLSGGAQKVDDAYKANGMSTDAHLHRETRPVIINALIQCFLIENLLQEPHDLVIRVSQQPDGDELYFETRIFKSTSAVTFLHL